MFTALNIEPESDSEDDIDNSKEIQARVHSSSVLVMPILHAVDRRSTQTIPKRS